jgi:hypothetical protein
MLRAKLSQPRDIIRSSTPIRDSGGEPGSARWQLATARRSATSPTAELCGEPMTLGRSRNGWPSTPGRTGSGLLRESLRPDVEGIVSKRADAADAPAIAICGSGQMPQRRGIRSDRLDRTRRCAAVSRRVAARLLRSRRKAHLRRPGRHRHQPGRAPTVVAAVATTRRFQNAARRAAAALTIFTERAPVRPLCRLALVMVLILPRGLRLPDLMQPDRLRPRRCRRQIDRT